MASPPTSLSFHGSHTPFLKHMFCLSSPSPPSSRPLCAVHSLQAETPSRSARLDVRLHQILQRFSYDKELGHGRLEIHHVKDEEEELDAASQLLAESDVLSRRLPESSVPIAAIVMKQYMVERRSRIPHTAMLVGFYKEEGDGKEAKPACVAEISFDTFGAQEAA